MEPRRQRGFPRKRRRAQHVMAGQGGALDGAEL
jgi:hypothetical protein